VTDTPNQESIGGVDCDIYYADYLLTNLTTYQNDPYKVGRQYALCFGQNARHENQWDCVFYIDGQLTDTIHERTELNSRVAGERAIFEDEFIPISQLEAGEGIQIRYRNLDGAITQGTPEYEPDPDKAYNIIIDSVGVQWTLTDNNHATTIPAYGWLKILSRGAGRFIVVHDGMQALLDAPIRISKNGIAAGYDDTVEIDFQSPGVDTPLEATEPVYFEVEHDGDAEWSETEETFILGHVARSVKGIKGFVKKSSPNISENSVQVNTVPTKELNFDDQSFPPPGEAVVNWNLTEEPDASIRIKGSVSLDEPIKPAMRCQWSYQPPVQALTYSNLTAVCSRIDCRRAQVVSPFGLNDAALTPYGQSHVVNSGPGYFELVAGPLVTSNEPNYNGGALEVNFPGRYLVTVDYVWCSCTGALEYGIAC